MKVLLADDDPDMVELLQAFLQSWGHTVFTARSGRDAWELLGLHDCPIVVTDWMMPDMDGLELIRQIRVSDRRGYRYVLLLSANAQKHQIVEGIEAGADDFLIKPFDPAELRARIRAGERIVRLEQTLVDQSRILQDAQAALVQTEKLASLGQMVAGVAHEVNNPLSYVMSNLAVLQRDVGGALRLLEDYRETFAGCSCVSREAVERLHRTEQEVDLDSTLRDMTRQFGASLEGLERIRDIVRNLKQFARLDEATTQSCDLNSTIGTTLEIVKHEATTRHVTVEWRPGPLPPVECQPGKINQVVMNVVLNALQACSQGGHVRVSSCRENDFAVVQVKDDGCGIPPEDIPHLFEPFFTTKAVGQGTGLGLAVSYGIVKDHGGEIQVESERGEGSCFRILLPINARKDIDHIDEAPGSDR